MIIDKLKPIPKYIEQRIKKLDKTSYPAQDGNVRFYSYLTKLYGQLMRITVAVKNRYRKWYCKQVIIHGVHAKKAAIKDIVFYYCGGYVVGWFEQGFTKEPKWFEDSEWDVVADKYFNPYAPVVNIEYLAKFPEYKYSAYELYTPRNILAYLRIYEQYPQAEYLIKFGLSKFAESLIILKKIGKDKQFIKWLISNKTILSEQHFYTTVILRAYRKQTSLLQEQIREEIKINDRHGNYNSFKRQFGDDWNDLCEYVVKQQVNISSYIDYFNACRYLSLDMAIPKNRYPHDFKRWHDIRTDEYATAKAIADEKQRAELYAKFGVISEKYKGLQYEQQAIFIMLIPKSPADLVREGETLSHCVGRMGYDQKMIREETLIFFVRNKAQPDTPLVTVEYSPRQNKILQCYGYKDSRPNENILDFVTTKWLPYANNQIKKLLAA